MNQTIIERKVKGANYPWMTCEIAERAYVHQLYQYLDQNSLLSSFQSGVRKSFSTETAVIFFIDNIRRNMDIGLLTGAIYIDLKKAFDTIDHNLLLSKLRRYGIDSHAAT